MEAIRTARAAYDAACEHDARVQTAASRTARTRATHELSDALAGRLLGERAFAHARDRASHGSRDSMWCELRLAALLANAIDARRFPLRDALHGTRPVPQLRAVLQRLLQGGKGLCPHEAPWLIHGLLYHLYDHAPLATETEARGLVVLCLASARRGVPTELLAIVAQYALLLPRAADSPLLFLALGWGCRKAKKRDKGRRPANGAVYVPDVVLAQWGAEPTTAPTHKRRRIGA